MSKNQCDGCIQGLPLNKAGRHIHDGYPHMSVCEKDKYMTDQNAMPELNPRLVEAAEILRQYRTNEAPIDSGNLYYAAMIYQEHLHTVWDSRDQMMINNGLMEAIRECESLGNIIHKNEAVDAIRALIDKPGTGVEPGDMLHGPAAS